MKKTNKFFAALLALMMTLSLAVPAFAAENDTVTITIQNTGMPMPIADGAPIQRTYDAYRLLDLTTSKNDDGTVNYAYTLNPTYAVILKELVFEADWEETVGTKPESKDKVTQEQVIAYLGTLDSDTVVDGEITKMGSVRGFMEEVYKKIKAQNITADVTGNNTGTLSGVAQGYWMIVDTTNFTGKDDANSLIIVDTKGQDEITVTPKTSVPTVDKEVKENSTGSWGDNADYNIGDDVPFKLTGTVTEYYDYYESYKFVFHDTLSTGLKLADDFNENSVTVKVDGTEITTGFEVKTTDLGDSCSFHVVFNDLKNIASVKADSKITVEYTAKLTDAAEIGNDGNLNSVKLEYSNNPNHSGGSTPPTGVTPEDKVVVFTYELDVDKVDGSSKDEDSGKYKTHLKDAWFALYRMNGQTKEYALIDNEGKITGWTETMPTHKDSEQNDVKGNLQSGEDGLFKLVGLDAGKYFLEETVAPAGFNLLTAPLELTIAAKTTEKADENGVVQLESLTVSVGGGKAQNGNVDNGTVSIIVENKSGAQLPSTGGMGTTLFYVVGGVLVAGAVVLFVTKKRMGVSEK